MDKVQNGKTLSSFIIDEQCRLGAQASGLFTGLLNDIAIACTGYQRILEVMPNGDPHQRVPVIMGSRNEVKKVMDYHRRG